MTESTSGKGRPTPKRKDAQRRRTGPVTPPPTTRKEAARRAKEKAKERRAATKAGRVADKPTAQYLMKRDQGPVRRLIRDLVDSRRHVSVLLLPAALVPFVAQLSGNERVLAFATTVWLAALLAAAADFTATAILVRKRVRQQFPDDTGRGHLFYAIMRTAQFRRLRLPRPVVAVGEQV